jgi:hypothetical protein
MYRPPQHNLDGKAGVPHDAYAGLPTWKPITQFDILAARYDLTPYAGGYSGKVRERQRPTVMGDLSSEAALSNWRKTDTATWTCDEGTVTLEAATWSLTLVKEIQP